MRWAPTCRMHGKKQLRRSVLNNVIRKTPMPRDMWACTLTEYLMEGSKVPEQKKVFVGKQRN